MHRYSRLILAALAATALLAVAVGGASARSLMVNERNFEFIWNEALLGKTKFRVRTAAFNIGCKLTLLGRFRENTIKKEVALTQGTINHGEVEACDGGTYAIRPGSLPWNMRYRGFAGMLPNITRITVGLIGMGLDLREPNGTECEVTTEVNRPGVFILEPGGEPETVTAEPANRIPLAGGLPCAFVGEAEFIGEGLVRNLPRTARLRITLI